MTDHFIFSLLGEPLHLKFEDAAFHVEVQSEEECREAYERHDEDDGHPDGYVEDEHHYRDGGDDEEASRYHHALDDEIIPFIHSFFTSS